MRFGVVGDPVMHSRSPAMHMAGFQALGIDAVFEHLPTKRDAFGSIAARLRSGDLDGVSVTMPHKANALAAVDVITDLARRSGAVNTITRSGDGLLVGTNTDVAGVIYALASSGADPDAPVLVLGAGGAAGAAIVACDARPLFVSARDEGTAEDVLNRTSANGTPVAWGEGVAGAVIVNATPIGMEGGSLPPEVLAVGSGIVDMTYGSGETSACAYFRALGLPNSDGLEMLLGQAIEAFKLFTGRDAPIDRLRDGARGTSH